MKKSPTMTQSALGGLLRYSPGFLLTSMVLSFLNMMVVQIFYYSTYVFMDRMPTAGFAYAIGIAIGLVIQFARFSFGLAGAKEFAEGKIGRGSFGMLFSFALTLFESFEVVEIATGYASGDSHLYGSTNMILQFVIWVGFVLELRLAITIRDTEDSNESTKEEEAQPSLVTPAPALEALGFQNPKLNYGTQNMQYAQKSSAAGNEQVVKK